MIKVITFVNEAIDKDYIYSVEPASRYQNSGMSDEELKSVVDAYNRANAKSGWRAEIVTLEADDPRFPMVRASLFRSQKIEQTALELVEQSRAAIENLGHCVEAIEKLLNNRNNTKL